jgi:ATP/maltotriose-dependent transcriptional regulator MalT/DNA-binding XRE family transcriptional regulator
MALPHVAETFGDLLKFLRRRERLTQRELAIAVGYTEAHICRLEKNERLPDLTTVAALFVPALYIEDQPALIEQLLKLAAQARYERHGAGHDALRLSSVTVKQITVEQAVEQELGNLEEIPRPLAYNVPRRAMLQRVHAALERDRCVVLVGLPGMGKTSLAAAEARQFEAGPVFWHTLIEGVNTSAEAIVRQLALFLLAHGQAQVRPLIERSKDAQPISLDQQILMIRAALAQQPALLCFDDAHLLIENEMSMSLLRHLNATTSTWLLLASRQDLPLPVAQINLVGLEPGEAHELAGRLGLNLEASLLNHLVEKTGGSPMLLRLAAGQLLESGSDTLVEHIELQPQVAAYLLNTVLHDLTPATQWLAGLIAVFRQPVDLYDETLSDLIEKADQPCCLEEALVELQRHHLVDDAHRAALHPLVRDHLYATLGADAPRRRRLHRLAAEWMEHGQGKLVEAAYHWMRAGELEQAAEVIGDRGELLFDQGKANAAVQVVDETLEKARRRRGDTASLRRRLLTARGDLLRGTFRAAEAEASYREALALAQNKPALRAQVVRSLAQTLMQRGHAAEALQLCQSAITDLGPTDTVLRARLISITSRAHLVLSHYDEAERTAKKAIALAGQFAEALPQWADEVRARGERTLGWVSYTRHPQGIESLQHYYRALEAAQRTGLRGIENAILSNIATALVEQGELESARQSYQAALKGYEALGDVYGTASVLHNLGILHSRRIEYEAALDCFEQASELERRVGDVEGLLSSEAARASMLLSMGKLAEARALLDHVLVEDKGSSDAWTLGTCLCLLAEVQLLQGEVEAARSTVQRALDIPGIQENARMHAWAQSGLALIQLSAGEISAAQQTVAGPPSSDLGNDLTFRWWLTQSAVALGSGNSSRALEIARAVLEAAEQEGFREAIPPAESLVNTPDLTVGDYLYLILSGRAGDLKE